MDPMGNIKSSTARNLQRLGGCKVDRNPRTTTPEIPKSGNVELNSPTLRVGSCYPHNLNTVNLDTFPEPVVGNVWFVWDFWLLENPEIEINKSIRLSHIEKLQKFRGRLLFSKPIDSQGMEVPVHTSWAWGNSWLSRGSAGVIQTLPGISYGCFQKIGIPGYPKVDGLQWKILLEWMIWGYHYFRKHPYHIFSLLMAEGFVWLFPLYFPVFLL